MELERSVPSTSCTARTINGVGELMALSMAIAVVAQRCQPSHLPVLVYWFGDPLGVRIHSDILGEWISENNLKELIRGIFTNPVRIQDSQSLTVVPSSLLSNRLKTSGKLWLVSTMMDRVAIGHTLKNRAFVATMAPMNLIYDITLFGFVSPPVHFIRPGGAGDPVKLRELVVLTAMHPEKEAHRIGLLLLP